MMCNKSDIVYLSIVKIEFSKSDKMIIGLTGLAGVGKSYVADVMLKLLTKFDGDLEPKIYSFSKPLKDILVILGFNKQHVFGSQAEKMIPDKNFGISPRVFMQNFGTEIIREILPKTLKMNLGIHDNIWIQIFDKFRAANDKICIIIDDLRFLDEADYIRRQGGVIVKILHAKDHPEPKDGIFKHKSESELLEIVPDYTIVCSNDAKILQDIKDILNDINNPFTL